MKNPIQEMIDRVHVTLSHAKRRNEEAAALIERQRELQTKIDEHNNAAQELLAELRSLQPAIDQAIEDAEVDRAQAERDMDAVRVALGEKPKDRLPS